MLLNEERMTRLTLGVRRSPPLENTKICFYISNINIQVLRGGNIYKSCTCA